MLKWQMACHPEKNRQHFSAINGRTAAEAKKQLDESRLRLRTDTIDLIQFHEMLRMEDADCIFDIPSTRAEFTTASFFSLIKPKLLRRRSPLLFVALLLFKFRIGLNASEIGSQLSLHVDGSLIDQFNNSGK